MLSDHVPYIGNGVREAPVGKEWQPAKRTLGISRVTITYDDTAILQNIERDKTALDGTAREPSNIKTNMKFTVLIESAYEYTIE